MSRLLKPVSMLLLLLLAAGCSDDVEKMKLTQAERERILPLQNPFGASLVRLHASGEDKPVLIGMQACKVYRAETEQGVVTEWVRLPEIDSFYPLPSACSRERLAYDGDYVTVEYCKTPMGAGGGCAGGISPHRSRNGRDWEVQAEKGKWKPVPK